MIKKIAILTLTAAFLTASPALAIQKKGKEDSKSKSVQTQNKSSEAGERNGNVTPPPKRTEKSSAWKPPKEKEKDRFIDNNDDGINDRIDRQPTVKIKKKDKPKEEGSKTKTKDSGSKSKHRPR
jgi:hypothetical protein